MLLDVMRCCELFEVATNIAETSLTIDGVVFDPWQAQV